MDRFEKINQFVREQKKKQVIITCIIFAVYMAIVIGALIAVELDSEIVLTFIIIAAVAFGLFCCFYIWYCLFLIVLFLITGLLI